MRKFKDFIYDCNDIVIALVVFAVAALIIFWRVDGIMAYSSYLDAKAEKQEIDIDFNDIDLDPIEDNPIEDNPTEDNPVENDDPVVQPIIKPNPDSTFVSAEEITLVIPKGAGCDRIARCVAEAYGYTNEDSATFINTFSSLAKQLGKETSMRYGTYKIPAGSSMTDIINKLS